MYTKAEASGIKKEFWTAFGRYMKPVKNAEGNTINWINYKTGVRPVYFRMDAGKKGASVAIEIKHPVAASRHHIFNKFESLKNYFSGIMQEEWLWQQEFYDEDGSVASRISIQQENVTVFDKECWPAIISFFKQRMIQLDVFWSNVKYQFQTDV